MLRRWLGAEEWIAREEEVLARKRTPARHGPNGKGQLVLRPRNPVSPEYAGHLLDTGRLHARGAVMVGMACCPTRPAPVMAGRNAL